MTLKDWILIPSMVMESLLVTSVILFFLNSSGFKKRHVFFGGILVTGLTADLFGFVGGLLLKHNMNIVYNVTGPTVFCLYILLYGRLFQSKRLDSILLLVMAIFIACAITNFFFIQTPTVTNSYTKTFGGLIAVCLSVSYFFHILNHQLPEQNLTKLPMFWINSAILILHSGTFVLFMFTSYFLEASKDSGYNSFIVIYSIHHILQIIFYSLVIVGLWKARSQAP